MTKSVRVLLVEDNPDHVYLLQEMLIEAGVTKGNIECVDRLSTAIEQLRKSRFEFVLLDLGLPDSEGYSTITSLHKREPTIPIVVITALTDKTLAVKAMQEGYVKFYLVKPIEVDQLRQIVESFQ